MIFRIVWCVYSYLLFNLSSKSSALTDYDLERLGGDADGGLVGH